MGRRNARRTLQGLGVHEPETFVNGPSLLDCFTGSGRLEGRLTLATITEVGRGKSGRQLRLSIQTSREVGSLAELSLPLSIP